MYCRHCGNKVKLIKPKFYLCKNCNKTYFLDDEGKKEKNINIIITFNKIRIAICILVVVFLFFLISSKI